MKKIEFREWSHTCSDGCCYTYGTLILIDGEEVQHPDSTQEQSLDNSYLGDDPKLTTRAILKHLKIDCEVI